MIDDDILVIDDFLTPSYHKNLKQTIENVSFKWKYLQNVTSYGDNEGTLNDYGFSHTIFNARTGELESEHAQFFEPFMFQVSDTAKCNGALRCRVDMVTHSSKEEFIHEPHVDFIGRQNVSSVYYVNDSDGDTIIYNEKEGAKLDNLTIKQRVSPKANRLLLFKGEFIHTGSTPLKNKRRILINSNYV